MLSSSLFLLFPFLVLLLLLLFFSSQTTPGAPPELPQSSPRAPPETIFITFHNSGALLDLGVFFDNENSQKCYTVRKSTKAESIWPRASRKTQNADIVKHMEFATSNRYGVELRETEFTECSNLQWSSVSERISLPKVELIAVVQSQTAMKAKCQI